MFLADVGMIFDVNFLLPGIQSGFFLAAKRNDSSPWPSEPGPRWTLGPLQLSALLLDYQSPQSHILKEKADVGRVVTILLKLIITKKNVMSLLVNATTAHDWFDPLLTNKQKLLIMFSFSMELQWLTGGCYYFKHIASSKTWKNLKRMIFPQNYYVSKVIIW